MAALDACALPAIPFSQSFSWLCPRRLLARWAVLVWLFLLCSGVAAAQDFTIIALPDTQYYSASYPATFKAQTQWIVNNAAAMNIKMVLGLGDIVDSGAFTNQWNNADAAVKLLDNAGIPYLLAVGNKDYANVNIAGRTNSLANFNAYFGPSRYSKYSYYKGQFPTGSNENFYGILTINSKQYLFLMLEFYPRDTAVSWAKSVIGTNPNAEVIVVTHSYVYIDSSRISMCDSYNAQYYSVSNDNDGEKLWYNFLNQYGNISLVLNGHLSGTSGGRGEGASRRTDLGVSGNIVNQILSDYQNLPNGGNGYLRILTFHPNTNTITVRTYSPTLNSYLTDGLNYFTVQWHASGPPAVGTGQVGGKVKRSSDCSAVSGGSVSTPGAQTTTSSSGSYVLGNLPAPNSAYTITAQAAGLNPASRDTKIWTGYPASLKFFLDPASGGAISGKVTQSGTATGIAGATVSYSGGSTTTGSTGSYLLPSVPAGTYTVTASATGYQSASQPISVTTGATSTANFSLSASTSTGPVAIRVNAGSSTALTDSSGNVWQADKGFNTGSTFSTTSAISAASGDPRLYQTLRYNGSSTTLQYNFSSLPTGTYTVRLYFAEIWSGCFSVGCRVFNVAVQGSTVFSNLDVFAAAGGGNKGIVRTTTATVSNGVLTISFPRITQNPIINAIEILQQ